VIVSHKYRFIFVKPQNVASTSLEMALSPHLGKDDIVTPFGPENEAIRRGNSRVRCQHYRTPLSSFRPQDYFELARNAYRRLRAPQKPEFVWPRAFYNHMPAWDIRARVG